MNKIVIFTVMLALAGCGVAQRLGLARTPDAAPPPPAVTPLGGTGKTAAALDTTSDAEKAAALAAPTSGLA